MNQRSPSNVNDDTRHRLQAIMVALVLAFLVLLLRLWYLQVIEGEHFAALSENNRIRIISQRDIRGQILDRNGKVLVDNRPSFTLSVLPEETAKLDLLIPRLKDQLPIRWEEVEPKLKMAYAYRTIQLVKDLTREQVAYVAEHRWDLPGVFLERASKRFSNAPYVARKGHARSKSTPSVVSCRWWRSASLLQGRTSSSRLISDCSR